MPPRNPARPRGQTTVLSRRNMARVLSQLSRFTRLAFALGRRPVMPYLQARDALLAGP